MNFPPAVGPLWGSWGRRLESTENLSLTSLADDSNSYCWPTLVLENTAGAEILEGDVWRALKSQPFFVGV